MARHVVIVGGGVVGLCTAWQMRKAGWAVSVLDSHPLMSPTVVTVDADIAAIEAEARLLRPETGYEDAELDALGDHEGL